jgi:hypothetical protein
MALDRITKLLAKIDRFSENPFEGSDVALEVPVGSRLPVQSEIEAVSDASEDADSVPAGAAVKAPEGPGVEDPPDAADSMPAGAAVKDPEEPGVEDPPDAATQSRPEAQDPGPPSRSLGASDLW